MANLFRYFKRLFMSNKSTEEVALEVLESVRSGQQKSEVFLELCRTLRMHGDDDVLRCAAVLDKHVTCEVAYQPPPKLASELQWTLLAFATLAIFRDEGGGGLASQTVDRVVSYTWRLLSRLPQVGGALFNDLDPTWIGRLNSLYGAFFRIFNSYPPTLPRFEETLCSLFILAPLDVIIANAASGTAPTIKKLDLFVRVLEVTRERWKGGALVRALMSSREALVTCYAIEPCPLVSVVRLLQALENDTPLTVGFIRCMILEVCKPPYTNKFSSNICRWLAPRLEDETALAFDSLGKMQQAGLVLDTDLQNTVLASAPQSLKTINEWVEHFPPDAAIWGDTLVKAMDRDEVLQGARLPDLTGLLRRLQQEEGFGPERRKQLLRVLQKKRIGQQQQPIVADELVDFCVAECTLLADAEQTVPVLLSFLRKLVGSVSHDVSCLCALRTFAELRKYRPTVVQRLADAVVAHISSTNCPFFQAAESVYPYLPPRSDPYHDVLAAAVVEISVPTRDKSALEFQMVLNFFKNENMRTTSGTPFKALDKRLQEVFGAHDDVWSCTALDEVIFGAWQEVVQRGEACEHVQQDGHVVAFRKILVDLLLRCEKYQCTREEAIQLSQPTQMALLTRLGKLSELYVPLIAAEELAKVLAEFDNLSLKLSQIAATAAWLRQEGATDLTDWIKDVSVSAQRLQSSLVLRDATVIVDKHQDELSKLVSLDTNVLGIIACFVADHSVVFDEWVRTRAKQNGSANVTAACVIKAVKDTALFVRGIGEAKGCALRDLFALRDQVPSNQIEAEIDRLQKGLKLDKRLTEILSQVIRLEARAPKLEPLVTAVARLQIVKASADDLKELTVLASELSEANLQNFKLDAVKDALNRIDNLVPLNNDMEWSFLLECETNLRPLLNLICQQALTGVGMRHWEGLLKSRDAALMSKLITVNEFMAPLLELKKAPIATLRDAIRKLAMAWKVGAVPFAVAVELCQPEMLRTLEEVIERARDEARGGARNAERQSRNLLEGCVFEFNAGVTPLTMVCKPLRPLGPDRARGTGRAEPEEAQDALISHEGLRDLQGQIYLARSAEESGDRAAELEAFLDMCESISVIFSNLAALQQSGHPMVQDGLFEVPGGNAYCGILKAHGRRLREAYDEWVAFLKGLHPELPLLTFLNKTQMVKLLSAEPRDSLDVVAAIFAHYAPPHHVDAFQPPLRAVPNQAKRLESLNLVQVGEALRSAGEYLEAIAVKLGSPFELSDASDRVHPGSYHRIADSRQKQLRLLTEAYFTKRPPMWFELWHVTRDSTQEQVEFILTLIESFERVRRGSPTFVIVGVNELSPVLQLLIVNAERARSQDTNVRIFYIYTASSLSEPVAQQQSVVPCKEDETLLAEGAPVCAWLADALMRRKIVWITGAAACGKTTLATQWSDYHRALTKACPVYLDFTESQLLRSLRVGAAEANGQVWVLHMDVSQFLDSQDDTIFEGNDELRARAREVIALLDSLLTKLVCCGVLNDFHDGSIFSWTEQCRLLAIVVEAAPQVMTTFTLFKRARHIKTRSVLQYEDDGVLQGNFVVHVDPVEVPFSYQDILVGNDDLVPFLWAYQRGKLKGRTAEEISEEFCKESSAASSESVFFDRIVDEALRNQKSRSLISRRSFLRFLARRVQFFRHALTQLAEFKTEIASVVFKQMLSEADTFCSLGSGWNTESPSMRFIYCDGTFELVCVHAENLSGDRRNDLIMLREFWKVLRTDHGLNTDTAALREHHRLIHLLALGLATGLEKMPLSESDLDAVLKQERYIVTLDVLLKMLHLHELRLCKVPVIIEGETGTGKSRMVEVYNHCMNIGQSLTLSTRLREKFEDRLVKWFRALGCEDLIVFSPIQRVRHLARQCALRFPDFFVTLLVGHCEDDAEFFGSVVLSTVEKRRFWHLDNDMTTEQKAQLLCNALEGCLNSKLRAECQKRFVSFFLRLGEVIKGVEAARPLVCAGQCGNGDAATQGRYCSCGLFVCEACFAAKRHQNATTVARHAQSGDSHFTIISPVLSAQALMAKLAVSALSDKLDGPAASLTRVCEDQPDRQSEILKQLVEVVKACKAVDCAAIDGVLEPDVDAELQRCIHELESSDWNSVALGCNAVRALMALNVRPHKSFFRILVDPSMTPDDLADKALEAVQAACELQKSNAAAIVTLFIDEANTFRDGGIMKTALADGAFTRSDGSRVKIPCNMFVVAAVNPARFNNKQHSGAHADMYQVVPLGASMSMLRWKIDPPKPEQESQYIAALLEQCEVDMPAVFGFVSADERVLHVNALSGLVLECQKFTRTHHAINAVSQRDIQRTLELLQKLFVMLGGRCSECKAFNEHDVVVCSTCSSPVLAQPRPLLFKRALLLAIGAVYWLRMEERRPNFVCSSGECRGCIVPNLDGTCSKCKNPLQCKGLECRETGTFLLYACSGCNATMCCTDGCGVELDPVGKCCGCGELVTCRSIGCPHFRHFSPTLKCVNCEQPAVANLRYELSQVILRHLPDLDEYAKKNGLTEKGKFSFSKFMEFESEPFLLQAQVPRSIARNQALRENLFAIVVCIQANIPVWIIGPPGSSKTLAFSLVESSLLGPSSVPFYQACVQPYVFPYQCSPASTSYDVRRVFDAAEQKQTTLRGLQMAVVFLDEASLTSNRVESLKVLHYYLDRRKVAFVGISNEPLDAAKQNRGLTVFRPDPHVKDLENVAVGCLKRFDGDDLHPSSKLVVQGLCRAYDEVISSPQYGQVYGLRDFYHLLRYFARASPNHGDRVNLVDPERLLEALQRNFGGLGMASFRDLTKGFFRSVHTALSTDAQAQRLFVSPPWRALRSPIAVLRSALIERTHAFVRFTADGNLSDTAIRFPMIVDRSVDGTAQRLLFSEGILQQKDTRIFELSPFQMDAGWSQSKERVVSDFQLAMQSKPAKTVILHDAEAVHASLYDVFNQHYRTLDGDMYLNVAIRAFSRLSLVNPAFRVLVATRKSSLHLQPLALLSRFEMYDMLVADALRDKHGAHDKVWRAAQHVDVFVRWVGASSFWGVFLPHEDDQDKDAISETVASVFLSRVDLLAMSYVDLVRLGIRKMLQLLAPQAVIAQDTDLWLHGADMRNHLNTYLEQEHFSLPHMLNYFAVNDPDSSLLCILTRTVPGIHAVVERVLSKDAFVVNASELRSEVDLDAVIKCAFASSVYRYFVITVDLKSDSYSKVNFIRSALERAWLEQPRRGMQIIVLLHGSEVILAKQKNARTAYTCIFLGGWEFAFLDCLGGDDEMNVNALCRIGLQGGSGGGDDDSNGAGGGSKGKHILPPRNLRDALLHVVSRLNIRSHGIIDGFYSPQATISERIARLEEVFEDETVRHLLMTRYNELWVPAAVFARLLKQGAIQLMTGKAEGGLGGRVQNAYKLWVGHFFASTLGELAQDLTFDALERLRDPNALAFWKAVLPLLPFPTLQDMVEDTSRSPITIDLPRFSLPPRLPGSFLLQKLVSALVGQFFDEPDVQGKGDVLAAKVAHLLDSGSDPRFAGLKQACVLVEASEHMWEAYSHDVCARICARAGRDANHFTRLVQAFVHAALGRERSVVRLEVWVALDDTAWVPFCFRVTPDTVADIVDQLGAPRSVDEFAESFERIVKAVQVRQLADATTGDQLEVWWNSVGKHFTMVAPQFMSWEERVVWTLVRAGATREDRFTAALAVVRWMRNEHRDGHDIGLHHLVDALVAVQVDVDAALHDAMIQAALLEWSFPAGATDEFVRLWIVAALKWVDSRNDQQRHGAIMFLRSLNQDDYFWMVNEYIQQQLKDDAVFVAPTLRTVTGTTGNAINNNQVLLPSVDALYAVHEEDLQARSDVELVELCKRDVDRVPKLVRFEAARVSLANKMARLVCKGSAAFWVHFGVQVTAIVADFFNKLTTDRPELTFYAVWQLIADKGLVEATRLLNVVVADMLPHQTARFSFVIKWRDIVTELSRGRGLAFELPWMQPSRKAEFSVERDIWERFSREFHPVMDGAAAAAPFFEWIVTTSAMGDRQRSACVMSLVLASYHRFEDRKQSVMVFPEAFWVALGLESALKRNLVCMFLDPSRMGLNGGRGLFDVPASQDVSLKCLQVTLVNVLALVLGTPEKTHLHTFLLNPGAIRGNLAVAFLYDYASVVSSTHYDCGNELGASGELLRSYLRFPPWSLFPLYATLLMNYGLSFMALMADERLILPQLYDSRGTGILAVHAIDGTAKDRQLPVDNSLLTTGVFCSQRVASCWLWLCANAKLTFEQSARLITEFMVAVRADVVRGSEPWFALFPAGHQQQLQRYEVHWVSLFSDTMQRLPEIEAGSTPAGAPDKVRLCGLAVAQANRSLVVRHLMEELQQNNDPQLQSLRMFLRLLPSLEHLPLLAVGAEVRMSMYRLWRCKFTETEVRERSVGELIESLGAASREGRALRSRWKRFERLYNAFHAFVGGELAINGECGSNPLVLMSTKASLSQLVRMPNPDEGNYLYFVLKRLVELQNSLVPANAEQLDLFNLPKFAKPSSLLVTFGDSVASIEDSIFARSRRNEAGKVVVDWLLVQEELLSQYVYTKVHLTLDGVNELFPLGRGGWDADRIALNLAEEATEDVLATWRPWVRDLDLDKLDRLKTELENFARLAAGQSEDRRPQPGTRLIEWALKEGGLEGCLVVQHKDSVLGRVEFRHLWSLYDLVCLSREQISRWDYRLPPALRSRMTQDEVCEFQRIVRVHNVDELVGTLKFDERFQDFCMVDLEAPLRVVLLKYDPDPDDAVVKLLPDFFCCKHLAHGVDLLQEVFARSALSVLTKERQWNDSTAPEEILVRDAGLQHRSVQIEFYVPGLQRPGSVACTLTDTVYKVVQMASELYADELGTKSGDRCWLWDQDTMTQIDDTEVVASIQNRALFLARLHQRPPDRASESFSAPPLLDDEFVVPPQLDPFESSVPSIMMDLFSHLDVATDRINNNGGVGVGGDADGEDGDNVSHFALFASVLCNRRVRRDFSDLMGDSMSVDETEWESLIPALKVWAMSLVACGSIDGTTDQPTLQAQLFGNHNVSLKLWGQPMAKLDPDDEDIDEILPNAGVAARRVFPVIIAVWRAVKCHSDIIKRSLSCDALKLLAVMCMCDGTDATAAISQLQNEADLIRRNADYPHIWRPAAMTWWAAGLVTQGTIDCNVTATALEHVLCGNTGEAFFNSELNGSLMIRMDCQSIEACDIMINENSPGAQNVFSVVIDVWKCLRARYTHK